ncbi:hypothetical protein BGZ65_007610 [Modicella reniformis]|uniref:Myb/SANT-like domain-containing protein n=1 Tax=Modicella reniformis TaxID=1440133 RepID=A0A9P6LXH8_9FUNG|nr:hypothetical protein BGZ65_007610 [Modicella reniformis]
MSSESSTTRKGFWATEGMDTFLNYITDPQIQEKLNNRQSDGTKAGDVFKNIADAVNEKHNVNWNGKTVKSKYQYLKKLFDMANDMTKSTGNGDTEDTTLRERILAKCPEYDRLYEVLGGTLARDPPSPFQSGDTDAIECILSDGEDSLSGEESGADSTDRPGAAPENGTGSGYVSVSEGSDEARLSDQAPKYVYKKTTSMVPAKKRKRTDAQFSFETFQTTMSEISEAAKAASEKHGNPSEPSESLSRREKSLEEEKKAFAEEKRAFVEAFAEEKKEFTKAFAEEKKAFAEEKKAFAEEKKEFSQEKRSLMADFKKERADLKQQQETFYKTKVSF